MRDAGMLDLCRDINPDLMALQVTLELELLSLLTDRLACRRSIARFAKSRIHLHGFGKLYPHTGAL